jgi:hypothetical protein
MTDYLALRHELDDDPLGRGYAGMTDKEAAEDLNITYRTLNKDTMTGSEVLNAIVITEFNALSAEDQRTIWDVLHISGDLNPFGLEATIFIAAFGGGSTTIANLASARVYYASRGEELGLSVVDEGDVNKARAMEGVE